MNKVMSWTKLVTIFVVMLVAFLWIDGNLAARRREEEARNNAVQMEIARLQKENGVLQQTLSQKDTKQNIESTAREYHQYMHEGEVAFEFDHPERLYQYTDEELLALRDEMNMP